MIRLARIGLICAIALAALGCGTPGTGASASPPSAPPAGAVITANALVFDRTALDVPAGRPFALLFENRESLPHNVSIRSADGTTGIFTGEVFSGPGSRTYQVPALAAGTYSFLCDVHPAMKGTVQAK